MSNNKTIQIYVPNNSVFTKSLPYLALKSGMKKGISGKEVDVDLSPVLDEHNIYANELQTLVPFISEILNGIYQHNGEKKYYIDVIPSERMMDILQEVFNYLNLPIDVRKIIVKDSADNNYEDSYYDEYDDNEYKTHQDYQEERYMRRLYDNNNDDDYPDNDDYTFDQDARD